MDTQIGLLDEKYSLALDDGSAFNSYNLMLTNLLLYLTNLISHDFFIHFDTSFSPSARLKCAERNQCPERNYCTDIEPVYSPRDISSNKLEATGSSINSITATGRFSQGEVSQKRKI